jgi:transitional endoplasmic reticulum ATPase
LNSTQDLSRIAEQLASWQPGDGPGISLCLYGPPGTGKSEYVRYLAHRMARPLLHRRASDILSCWVGETERRIAAAFERADNDGAVLLFDEVDSFLRNRRSALRSWEVTEVNELLQQLESFRGVVACTTNLWQDIDEAALRRFVFKIELGFLRTDQALTLFHSTFADLLAAPLTPADEAELRETLARLPNLTPGDFAVVARRERALRRRARARALTTALTAEARAKHTRAQRIGF